MTLKLILAENLTETNFIYRLRKTKDDSRLNECILSLLLSEDKDARTKLVICILEYIRDYPKEAHSEIKDIIQNFGFLLEHFLKANDMEYMYDFFNEIILDPDYKFIDDLFDVI